MKENELAGTYNFPKMGTLVSTPDSLLAILETIYDAFTKNFAELKLSEIAIFPETKSKEIAIKINANGVAKITERKIN
ncbi:MAG: hypothetical protein Q8N88_06725, partial [Nanoarchaeota archaeon]|nr:hypothetical protein [Nanoarchaeota archaeon]